jgi:isochorismatase family protein
VAVRRTAFASHPHVAPHAREGGRERLARGTRVVALAGQDQRRRQIVQGIVSGERVRGELGGAQVGGVHGHWHCSAERAVAVALAGRTSPDKGEHSAFYATPLPHSLDTSDTTDVVVSGRVTEQCVLYTALDATCAATT